MKRIFALMVALVVVLVCACTIYVYPENPYINYEQQIEEQQTEEDPRFKITPFEGYYAQVDIYDANAEIPERTTIDGATYAVVVINSCVAPEGPEKQTSLNIKEGIMAINSGAYAKFEDVTTVELPSSLQVLGAGSLPPNTTELTIPSRPCQNLKTALADVSTVKKVTITDRGFADLSALTSLEEVTVVDGVWPYFPNLPDKVEEGLYFQGFIQDGVYCETCKAGKGTAIPVWAEPREGNEFWEKTGVRFWALPFTSSTTEERFRISYEEPIEAKEATEETEAIEGTDYWTFTVGTDGGYTYKWYINNKEVFTNENHTIERGDEGQIILKWKDDEGQIILKWKDDDISTAFSNTVQCALYEGEELKATTQFTLLVKESVLLDSRAMALWQVYWKYKATKTGGASTHGQTDGFVPLGKSNSGFAPGEWKFQLAGYLDSDYQNQIYLSEETTAVVKAYEITPIYFKPRRN